MTPTEVKEARKNRSENENGSGESQLSGDERTMISKKKQIEIIDEIIGDMAKAAIEGVRTVDQNKEDDDDDDDVDTKDSVVKKSIVPFDIEDENIAQNIDPNLLVTTEDIDSGISSYKSIINDKSLIPEEDESMEIEKRSEIPTEEISTIEDVYDDAKNSVNDDSINQNEYDSSQFIRLNTNMVEKRSEIPMLQSDYSSFQIDPDTQAIIDDVVNHDKRFLIPKISKKYNRILEEERKEAELDDKNNKGDKRTTSSIYHATRNPQKNISVSFPEKPKQAKVKSPSFRC